MEPLPQPPGTGAPRLTITSRAPPGGAQAVAAPAPSGVQSLMQTGIEKLTLGGFIAVVLGSVVVIMAVLLFLWHNLMKRCRPAQEEPLLDEEGGPVKKKRKPAKKAKGHRHSETDSEEEEEQAGGGGGAHQVYGTAFPYAKNNNKGQLLVGVECCRERGVVAGQLAV